MPGAVQVRALLGSSLRVGPGLHLFNKPGSWLTVLSRMARDSRHCAGPLWCYWLCMGRCVHSGVFCRVWGITAGWGVAGATHSAGWTACVAGRCVGVAGATLVVTCLSGLMASGWHSHMWLQACQYCPPPMTWTRYDPWSAVWMTVVGSHRHLASLRTDTDCLANRGAFCWQPWQSWFAALREACWSRWSWSAVAFGSLWQICCGTVVCKACC